MLVIRSLILDGVALLGIVIGVAAGVGGYLHDATAKVTSGAPDATGSVVLRRAGTKTDAWAEPPYHRSRW